MDIKQPPSYTLYLSTDRANVRDIIIGLLHTIFFHRVFTTLQPATHDVLDLTLPYLSEDEIETTIEKRTNAFIRQLESSTTSPTTTTATPNPSNTLGGGSATSTTTATGAARGKLTLQFLEKKRKKSWFVAKADEETVWENWTLDVTVATAPRSEPEAVRNRRQMEMSLHKSAMKVIDTVNREKGHIPPITTTETNPFPFQILI